MLGVQEVASSNLAAPTIFSIEFRLCRHPPRIDPPRALSACARSQPKTNIITMRRNKTVNPMVRPRFMDLSPSIQKASLDGRSRFQPDPKAEDKARLDVGFSGRWTNLTVTPFPALPTERRGIVKFLTVRNLALARCLKSLQNRVVLIPISSSAARLLTRARSMLPNTLYEYEPQGIHHLIPPQDELPNLARTRRNVFAKD